MPGAMAWQATRRSAGSPGSPLRAILIRITVPRTLLLACALSGLHCLEALLLSRLQIECVFLDVLDDFLIHHFSLKAFERALQALAIIYVNFSHGTYLGSLGGRGLRVAGSPNGVPAAWELGRESSTAEMQQSSKGVVMSTNIIRLHR